MFTKIVFATFLITQFVDNVLTNTLIEDYGPFTSGATDDGVPLSPAMAQEDFQQKKVSNETKLQSDLILSWPPVMTPLNHVPKKSPVVNQPFFTNSNKNEVHENDGATLKDEDNELPQPQPQPITTYSFLKFKGIHGLRNIYRTPEGNLIQLKVLQPHATYTWPLPFPITIKRIVTHQPQVLENEERLPTPSLRSFEQLKRTLVNKPPSLRISTINGHFDNVKIQTDSNISPRTRWSGLKYPFDIIQQQMQYQRCCHWNQETMSLQCH